MAKFTPAMLVPAILADKAADKRTSKDVALANISKMREQFAAGLASEGKRNFKHIEGDRIEFTIRVSNTALVLETAKVQDTDVEVREMTVPTVHFDDALQFYADRIRAGEYDAQLATFDGKREQRTTKLKATRAEKKQVEKKAA